jgi:hypothetical protein
MRGLTHGFQRCFKLLLCLSLAAAPLLKAQTGNGASFEIRAAMDSNYSYGVNALSNPPGVGRGGR